MPWQEEVAPNNLLFLRWYELGGAVEPLTLRRPRWGEWQRGQAATTVPEQFHIILADSIMRVLCNAPQFKSKDRDEFVLNDLVHLPGDRAIMYQLPWRQSREQICKPAAHCSCSVYSV